ncbi:VacJ family lipoprotein [Sulfurimonas sp.]|uniref:MlaA family lipoprotein n=1 Tax=Sulfurimonas sp. TaxID=2022749 RepID=UPI00261EE835|nr:VacJ family lipoprotein [Sulfurimonas sp.]MCW8894316.1 VacJ family lipoprotein [Sulfurimonas sp.]
MKLAGLIFMVFMVFGFSGCISQSVEEPQKPVLSEEVSSDADDELDEFAEEMQVKEVYDPFSGYNRSMTSFNDGAYEYVFKPVAQGYRYLFHEEIRMSVQKFFHNLYFPMRVVNNALQGKFKNSAEETGRFVINSTVGILGLFDPAKSKFGLQAHEEDFGQTLGFYGAGSGPHIVLPFIGPSNLRDTISLYPDSLLTPIDYTERSYWTLTDTVAEYLGVKSVEKVNYASLNMERYDKLKQDAVDLYPYLRDLYEQYRDKQIEE